MRDVTLVWVALTLALVACERTGPALTQDTTSTSATSATSAAAHTSAKVAKIVFIDKQEACDCTRKRIETTWAALQTALGTPAALPVERIHIDTQAALAEAYTVFKPLMVPPGIYFVDAHNAVIDILQGEVKADRITAVLNGR